MSIERTDVVDRVNIEQDMIKKSTEMAVGDPQLIVQLMVIGALDDHKQN